MHEELSHFLNLYWHVEDGGPEYLNEFKLALSKVRDPERAARFKHQLAEALVVGSVSREDFETWTLMDFDSDDDLMRELWTVWRGLYPGETPDDYLAAR